MDNITNETESYLLKNPDGSKKPRIWKISHGKPKPHLISKIDNETLMTNGYVGFGWADKPDHRQRKDFLAIASTDYFYLVREGHIILLGKLTNDEPILGQLTNDETVTINDNSKLIVLTNPAMKGWTFRKFEIVEPCITPYKIEIKNSKGGMPSSQSTVQEVKTSESLKCFETEVLKPVFNLELNKLGITVLLESKKVINSEQKSIQRESQMSSLNQILYGPPGTGKTYSTVIKALKIFDGVENIDEDEEYEEGYLGDKQQFDALKSKGHIQFVTFHQSFSYEDFVEGIRAETNAGGALSYSIKDGVFKTIAIEALYSKFKNEYAEQLEYIWQEAKSKNIYQNKITADTKFDPDIYDHKKLILSDCKIADFTAGTGEPYVLIIDEINRGNTSRIFGELITLIEDTKRAGTDEAMTALLPYSQENFIVPDNLYIIGTMNTADRSLALIDTALRRRFDFIEMMPKPSLIIGDDEQPLIIDGIEIQKMLETINNRIEALYDREHTIGHAFFMKLKDDSTINHLASIFRNKILPLLEEYFFEDWKKITQVLGNSGIYEDKTLTKMQLGFEPSGKNYSRNGNDDKLAKAQTYINIYSTGPVQQD